MPSLAIRRRLVDADRVGQLQSLAQVLCEALAQLPPEEAEAQ
jgi:hypothetical protein